MKKLVLSLAIAAAAVTPALAPALADEPMQSKRSDTDCIDLMRQAEAGLRSSQMHDVVRDRLQQMLDVGRSGDISSCQSVANGSLAMPKAEDKSCAKPAV
jgi:hypothetical protein